MGMTVENRAQRVIGLQTRHDLRNFSACVHALLPNSEQQPGASETRFEFEGLTIVAGAFPIGIDYDEFATVAATCQAPWSDRFVPVAANVPGAAGTAITTLPVIAK